MMMKYSIRKGIVLTSVCGQYLLVSSTAAREFCPYVARINDAAAYIWGKLELGADLDQLYDNIREDFDTEDEDIVSMVNEYLEQLAEGGYLIRTEE